MSKPTFYKYVDLQVIMLTNLDLPKKVKYKKRKEIKHMAARHSYWKKL